MSGHITLQATSVQRLCECLLTLATYSATQHATMPPAAADGGSVEDATMPPAAADGVAVIQTTQPALFKRAGLAPRTGARALALLTQAGLVSSGRGSLTILNTHRLSQAARGELAGVGGEGGEGGNMPPPAAEGGSVTGGRVARRVVASSTGGKVAGQGVASSPAGEAGEAQSLRAALVSASAEVVSLRGALAALAGEVQNLRAEVTAARSSGAVDAPAPSAPAHSPPLDVDALVRRIVDALRVALPATLPPTHPTAAGAAVQAQGEGVEGATLPPATLPPTKPTKGRSSRKAKGATLPPVEDATSPPKGRGSRGTAEGLADLQRLVSLAKNKRGKRGSVSGAALLIGGITGDGIGKALKAGRVTPDVAARVRAALASLDAAEG
jgi:hypothetical protein